VPTINPEVVPSNVKLNVTNMKTIFNGGGKGGAIVPKKGGGALARSGGALSSEKVFQLNDFDPLEKRVAANEKKITLLKNVLKAQKPFGGNEDKLAEINSTLQDIGNALSLDFANRITEGKEANKLRKKENEERKKNLAEKSVEGIKGAGKKLGAGIKGVAASVVSPFKNVFDKLISFVTLLGAGIAGNAAITWWQNLDQKWKDRITGTFNFLAKHWKWLAAGVGVLLLTKVVKKVRQLWKLIKFVGKGFFKVLNGLRKGAVAAFKGIKSIFKHGVKRAGKRALIKTGMKTSTKVASKVTSKVATKTATKVATKATTKAVGKSVLKKIPFIGLGAGLLFAGQRALAGDWTGAGLELASGAASMVPGVGTGLSIAIDAGTVARDIHRANNNPEVPDLAVDETKVVVEDLPPVKVPPPEKKVPAPETTEVDFISSINPLNEYMTLTPALHGIV
tara:strand:+ start:800 stop:2152 length:1353 start_codon:yes stop_codon:yes gene_type:complete